MKTKKKMAERVRRLSAALIVWILSALTPAAEAQQTAPAAWPPIDVWGVSGRPIGTIRVAQPTVNGIFRYSLIASFMPLDGKLLPELAAALWPGADRKCLHFNWIQVTLESGKPPVPMDAAGKFMYPPFIDPPAGGYQGDRKPADALPWFLDETPYVSQQSAGANIHNPNVTLPNTLRWYANPYSEAVPDAMRYDTVLVLINDCTAQYEPLGGFHWVVRFPEQGSPSFAITPFGPKEWFAHAGLVKAFAESARTKQKLRLWTLRPLVKP